MDDWSFLQSAIEQAGSEMVKLHGRTGAFEKQGQGVVTEADLLSETRLLEVLGEYCSQDAIWSEESFPEWRRRAGESGRVWILDPLDGTTNYKHGMNHYCISVARASQASLAHLEVDLGIVYKPSSGTQFMRIANGQTFVEGKPLTPLTPLQDIATALVGVGISYHKGSALREDLNRICKIGEVCRSLRISGSCALDICQVALGQLDGFFELGVKPWDFAAAGHILRGVGGELFSFSGSSYGPYDVRFEGVLCGRPGFAAEAAKALGLDFRSLSL